MPSISLYLVYNLNLEKNCVANCKSVAVTEAIQMEAMHKAVMEAMHKVMMEMMKKAVIEAMKMAIDILNRSQVKDKYSSIPK